MLSNPSDNPAQCAKSFISQIIVLNHPNKIHKGYSPVMNCHTLNQTIKFEKLLSTVDRRNLKVISENPESIGKGDCAIVEVTSPKPMIVESFSKFPPLGRFVVRDMRMTVAVGVIKTVNFVEKKIKS